MNKLFEGRIKEYAYTEIWQPYVDSVSSQPDTHYYEHCKDHKILSIYSLLKCVKMQAMTEGSFRRYMLTPTSKIYVEDCFTQDEVNDFLCSLVMIE